MKRIVTMCLTTMLLLSIALAVYGDVGNTTTQITMSITDEYVFDIPRNVPVDGGELKVSISDKQSSTPVYVFFRSTNCYQYHTLCLINENNNLIYYKLIVNNNPNDVLYESVDGEFNIGTLNSNGTITLNCELISSGPFPPGNYSDTLSFFFR